MSNILVEFTDALSALAANAREFVALVDTAKGHAVSGVLWKPDVVVVSEQALANASEFEVTVAGQTIKASLAGRDEGTNVAVLKLEKKLPQRLPAYGEAKT